MGKFYTGYKTPFPATLTDDGETAVLDTSWTVTAALVSKDHKTRLSEISTCSPSATGADWANGVVVVDFSETDTSSITVQDTVQLEISVDDGENRYPYFGSISIGKGQIP